MVPYLLHLLRLLRLRVRCLAQCTQERTACGVPQWCTAGEVQCLQLRAVLLEPAKHVWQLLLALAAAQVECEAVQGLVGCCIPCLAHQGHCLHELILIQ